MRYVFSDVGMVADVRRRLKGYLMGTSEVVDEDGIDGEEGEGRS